MISLKLIPGPAEMRKILITLAVVLGFPVFLAAVFFLGRVSGPWESSDCSHDELGSVPSPDKQWDARLTYFACGSPLTGYLRDYTTVAILKPGQTPTAKAIAVEVEHEPEQKERPINLSDLAWQSNGRLQISLRESARMSNLRPRVAAITVDVTRVPDKMAADTAP